MLVKHWENYNHPLIIEQAADLIVPRSKATLTRSATILQSGLFRLSRKTCSLYSVEIKSCGAWGRILILDGDENEVFFQPSTFTGSFVLDACCWNGLYVWNMSGPGSDSPINVNWREP